MDDFLSSGSKLKIDYQGHPTLAYDGFKVLITSFRGKFLFQMLRILSLELLSIQSSSLTVSCNLKVTAYRDRTESHYFASLKCRIYILGKLTSTRSLNDLYCSSVPCIS